MPFFVVQCCNTKCKILVLRAKLLYRFNKEEIDMQEIFRGTTPILRFEFPFEYQYLTKMTVTFAQDGTNLLKINMGDSEIYSIEDFMVSVQLTQEETNQFKHTFPVSAQVKVETDDGEVWAGEVKNYVVHRILDTDIFDTAHEEEEEK